MLTGKTVTLRPATVNDRQKIFEWLTQSDITSKMIGPPDFPENEIPTWEEFIADYHPGYFNSENPDDGKSFIIEVNGEEVGQINYGEIYRDTNMTELDIWLGGNKYCNKGYGTDAIKTLCEYLFSELKCERIIIAPSAKNTDAVRAYEKCGFVITNKIPAHFIPDYHDTVVLEKFSAD